MAEVQLGKTATVEVTFRAKRLPPPSVQRPRGKSDQVDPNRKLIVQLLAKGHFDPVR